MGVKQRRKIKRQEVKLKKATAAVAVLTEQLREQQERNKAIARSNMVLMQTAQDARSVVADTLARCGFVEDVVTEALASLTDDHPLRRMLAKQATDYPWDTVEIAVMPSLMMGMMLNTRPDLVSIIRYCALRMDAVCDRERNIIHLYHGDKSYAYAVQGEMLRNMSKGMALAQLRRVLTPAFYELIMKEEGV